MERDLGCRVRAEAEICAQSYEWVQRCSGTHETLGPTLKLYPLMGNFASDTLFEQYTISGTNQDLGISRCSINVSD